jgi:hypothetical protein
MINHENLERFLSKAPLQKVGIVAGTISLIFLILAGMIFAVYKIGVSNGAVIRNQKLENERNESILREKLIRAEAEKLAGVNDLLKAQNEAQSELLIQTEAKRNKENAEKLKEIFDIHQQKIEEIESETDVKNHIRRLCDEVKTAGYQLSDELCPLNQ